MRPFRLLAFLAALCASSTGRAQTQTQTCSANAPQVNWTIGTLSQDGTPNTVGVQEVQYIINSAECACDTSDLYIIGTVTKGITTNVTTQVWVGTNCNTISSQPTNCQQITDVDNVAGQNFYTGGGASNRPSQHIPVRALIAPKTTQNPNPAQCPDSSSIGNSMFILFPFDMANPDYCAVLLTAKTSLPAAPLNLSAESGDEAITLRWQSPSVGTIDAPSYFQVLCADEQGNPIPGEGAYGFGDPTGPPHQLAYSTCIDPANHTIQRRYIATTSVGSGTTDGGTGTTSAALTTTGSDLGVQAALPDAGSSDMTASPSAAMSALATLDRKFVCSDRINVVGTDNELRIGGLTNGLRYTCLVVGIDKWGNASPSDVTEGTPQPVEDLYRRFLSQGGKPQGFCFIATAAYGSYQHPYVRILRQFRDDVLLPTGWGAAFVAWYYRTSPPYAAWIAEHDGARFVVRLLLWPVIGLAWVHLHLAAWQELLLGALLLVLLFRRRLVRLTRRARSMAATTTVDAAVDEAGA